MNEHQKNKESQLLKDLKQGKYRNHYLIYNRKSTDEPNNQKNSIQYQKKENSQFAYNKRLLVAELNIKSFCSNGIISERHSGFKEDDNVIFTKDGLVQYRIERPKFQKLLEYINKGYFKGVISLSWDRISRNKADDTIVRKLMRKGADFQFTFASYDNTSSGALHMDIDSMFSHHRSRVTSEKVTLATKNLRERGFCTYRAPIGYLNTGTMENKPFDPDRAPFIEKLFKLYASGDYSLSDLARLAKQEGIVTVPMRRKRTEEELLAEEEDIIEIEKLSRPLTANHISRILSNPFYTGKILTVDGSYITSNSHKPLTNQTIFNAVQKLLKKNRVSVHYDKKLALPYRGVIRCGICNRVYTPYTKKGHTYYGARCMKPCKNKTRSFNLDYLEKQTSLLMSSLHFSNHEMDVFNSHTGTEIALLEQRRHDELTTIEKRKKRVRESLSYLNSNKLVLLQSNVFNPETLLKEQNKLEQQLDELQQLEQSSDIAMRETVKNIVKLSELLKTLGNYYHLANSTEKEHILRLIFSELYLTNKTLEYKLKIGLECFEKRIRAFCDHNARLSELQKLNPDSIKDMILTIESILPSKKD